MLQWQSYCNTNVSSQYVVYLKLIEYCMSVTSQLKIMKKLKKSTRKLKRLHTV